MDVTEDPMIRLEGVGKTYADGTVAVQDLDLDVKRGEMVCLVGPSGCGKSTTLKMVMARCSRVAAMSSSCQSTK